MLGGDIRREGGGNRPPAGDCGAIVAAAIFAFVRNCSVLFHPARKLLFLPPQDMSSNEYHLITHCSW
jgi:hypothetical protein